jgi:hypothetical protein
MPSKPLELPLAIARRFVQDLRAYHCEKNPLKQDEIAIHQLRALQEHYDGKLRLSDIKRLFESMKDLA